MMRAQPRWLHCALLLAGLAGWPLAATARVVINEIYYHAPDGIEDLQYIELHNNGDEEVNLGSWSFTKGIQFKFPPGTILEPNGFLVICRNRERFKEYFDVPVAGVFDSHLSRNGERLELSDPRGRVVDTVKYQDQAPWPLGADGLSGSLERICPEAGGDNPANWAATLPSSDRRRPTGTPGKVNLNHASHLPPVVSQVKVTPEDPHPEQPIEVEAAVRAAEGVREVRLLYRIAGTGFEKPEVSVAMKETSPGRYAAELPGQKAGQLVRFRVMAIGAQDDRRFSPAESEPRPAHSVYVADPADPGKIPFGWILQTTAAEAGLAQRRRGGLDAGGGAGVERGARTTRSAFIFLDPATRKRQLFDFVEVELRKGGYAIHFAKGQPFLHMTTLHLVSERNEKLMLTEPLAYEVYRKAGLPAAHTDHVRLWLNGQPVGYHLLLEPPNRAFLRRNNIKESGNLYAVHWSERGRLGQHESKTSLRGADDDLARLLEGLAKTTGHEQWEFIKKNFDAGQVATYFAVNEVLSHWDGFFQHYVAYHDVKGTGRWTLYPWNQAQTWGVSGIMGPGEVFYTLPVTFATNSLPETAPSAPANPGVPWWRPGGYFSRPLLANPEFRKVFLARTRQLLETVYTEQVFLPWIDGLGERLRPEVEFRAQLEQRDAAESRRRLEQNLQELREHLVKRRAFLLAQDEIRNAGEFSTAGLGGQVSKKSKTKAN